MKFFNYIVNEISKKPLRLLLCSKLGSGKTTFLQYLNTKLANNYDAYNIIPLFVDASKAVYEESIIKYLLLKYGGSLTEKEKSNDTVRQQIFHEYLNNNKYKFLIIIDSTDLLTEEKYDKLINDLEELNKLASLSIIFSTCNKDIRSNKAFENYKHNDNFGLLNEQQIKNHLITHGFTVDTISSSWIGLLNTPFYLTKFVNTDNNKTIDLATDVSIGKSTLIEDYINEIIDLNIPKNYSRDIAERNKRKCLVNIDIPKLVFEANKPTITIPYNSYGNFLNSIPFLDVLEDNEKDGKYECEINHSLYFYYMIAKHLKNCLNKCFDECIIALNMRIFDIEILLFLGEQLNLKNETRQTSRLFECLNHIRKDDIYNVTKYQIATCNILRIFALTCSDQLSGLDLSYLDLSMCNFIGVDCTRTIFNNCQLADECFIPIEPEESSLFAISDDGHYFITGNEYVLNIRSIDRFIAIDRIFSDNDNKFISISSCFSSNFEILTSNYILCVCIENNKIYQWTKSLDDIDDDFKKSESYDIPTEITKKGEVCCVNNDFVLLKSNDKSLYGNTYLLFNIQNKKLISVHKFFSHLKTYRICQDGDEIEFLPFNNGKPLKTICFNEKSGEIYRKQYPSMIGRGVLYEDGTKIFFDTDNTNSYLKYYFFNSFFQPYANKFTEKSNNINLKISEIKNDETFTNNKVCTKNLYHVFEHKSNQKYLISGNYISTSAILFSNYEISSHDFRLVAILKSNAYFKSFHGDFNIPVPDGCVSVQNINITKNKIFLISNRVCSMDETSLNVRTIQSYKLIFIDEYKYIIDIFPWKETAEKIINKLSSDRHYTNPDRFYVLCKNEVRKALKILSSNVELNIDYIWGYSISRYIHDYLFNLFISSTSPTNELISNDKFITGFKHYCFPCDTGIIYYNGEYTCYLRLVNGEEVETKWCYGYVFNYFRNNVHLSPKSKSYNVCNFYKLYDIYKDHTYNQEHAPMIPIYDLNLYYAKFDDVNGLSPVALDIIKRQTEIETHYLTFDE